MHLLAWVGTESSKGSEQLFYLPFFFLFLYLPAAIGSMLALLIIRKFVERLAPSFYKKPNFNTKSFIVVPGFIYPILYISARYLYELSAERTDDEIIAIIAGAILLISTQLVPKLFYFFRNSNK